MAENKFTPDYFEKNYHIVKNTVYRNNDSSGCNAKEECLRACFTYFTKDDYTKVKKISHHFKTNGREIREAAITRCCCSQIEDSGITHVIVTHKVTDISFIVGRDCFYKLFKDADDADTFFKEMCKECGKFVKSRSINRPNFCNFDRCKKNYDVRQFLLKEKERRAELSKKWKEEAKVYEQCIECDKPKYTEKQRKFKLCYDCYQTNQLDTSSEDETELFIDLLSIS